MKTLGIVCLIGIGLTSCKPAFKNLSQIKGTTYVSGCDVNYDRLNAPALQQFEDLFFDNGIEASQKIKHLNELSLFPSSFFEVLRKNKIKIKFAKDRVTEFPELQGMEKSIPRNWNNGKTTADVAGIYVPWSKSVLLARTSLASAVHSLALHETAHALDASWKISSNLPSFQEMFAKDKAAPAATDRQKDYRFGNIEEYFAMGLDAFYCSASSRMELKSQYPSLHSFIETELPRLTGNDVGAAQVQVPTKDEPVIDPKPNPQKDSKTLACSHDSLRRWVVLSDPSQQIELFLLGSDEQNPKLAHCEEVCLQVDPETYYEQLIEVSTVSSQRGLVDRLRLRKQEDVQGRCQ